MSKGTFFKWLGKYGGASISDLKRHRELETENAKLKRMCADLAQSRVERQGMRYVQIPMSTANRRRRNNSALS